MEDNKLKLNICVTIDDELLRKIEKLRGRENRSSFIGHLLKLGIKEYREEK